MKTGTLIFCFTVLLVLTFSFDPAMAINSKAGTHAYSFLKIPAGAKAPAMGGAHTGIASDAYSAYYNPAGIALVPGSEITASYNNYLSDIQGGYLSYVFNWGQRGKLGFTANYLNFGDTPKLDRDGNDLGEFGGGDLALGLTYARKWEREDEDLDPISGESYTREVLTGFAFGATAKFIYEKVDEYSSDAIALDLGFLYGFMDRRTSVGVSASNLGFQLKGLSSGHQDPLPAIIRAGIGHTLKAMPFTIALDAIKPIDNDFRIGAGVNFIELEQLELRAGYNTIGEDYKTGSDSDDWGGISFGAGLKLDKFVLDYAFIPFADLGNSHRLAISSRW